MIIEDYWLDIDMYHVSFEVNRDNDKISKLHIINKIVAFPCGMTKDEIEEAVRKQFSKVKQVSRIDFLEDALLLKSKN